MEDPLVAVAVDDLPAHLLDVERRRLAEDVVEPGRPSPPRPRPAVRSSAVIIPSSNIRRSTYRRRSFADSGRENGEYRDGACGSPAMSAASASVRSSTFFRK